MNNRKVLIAVGLLLLPLAARLLFYYPGFGLRPKVATPDYSALTMPPAPLATPAKEEKIRQFGGVVLVDYTHANQFQSGELQALKQEIEKRGGRLELLIDPSLLENHFKYSSSFVVLSPSAAFSAFEISQVQSFVTRGGRLAVFADATRGQLFTDFFSGASTNIPDTYALNPLLAPFGITVNNDYLYNLQKNEANFRNVFFDQFGKSELTFGLKQVVLYGTHSVSSDTGLVLLRGNDTTFSSISDAHDETQGGGALNADGNVVAFGDFTFLTAPYDHVADNGTLIANLADYLLSGKQSASLSNFPYLFKQSVLQVYASSDVQITAEMVGALGRLQSSFQQVNLSMQMVSEKPSDGDVLILADYSPSDDLDSISSKFNLNVDSFGDSISVPGIGEVGRAGNGVLLYDAQKKGNTLVLLADNLDDLTALVDVLGSGVLNSCLLEDKAAVCSVGFGGSFGTPQDFFGGFPPFGEFTPTPFVESTPTP